MGKVADSGIARPAGTLGREIAGYGTYPPPKSGQIYPARDRERLISQFRRASYLCAHHMQSKSYQKTSEKLHRGRQLLPRLTSRINQYRLYYCRLSEASGAKPRRRASRILRAASAKSRSCLGIRYESRAPSEQPLPARRSLRFALLRPRLQRLGARA